MRWIIYLFLMILCGANPIVAAHSVEDVPNVHLADRQRYVSNPDGVLSAEAVSAIDRILGDVWQSTSSEFVVVALDDVDTDDIDGFATKLFEEWGIGKRDNDNGVLMLIVRDKRRAVIRTGYGAEGVLPDIVCGRVIRENMIPHYRVEDYDAGTVEAVKRIGNILTDPEVAEEVRSKYANDEMRDTSGDELFSVYMWVCAVIALAYTVLVVAKLCSTRKMDAFDRYNRLNKFTTPGLFLSFGCLGMPLPGFLLLVLCMRRIRNHRRECPNCGHKMNKLDEKRDNDYLTPAQDLEERINSIDYDVWLCPECHEKDVIPYVNRASAYTVCPHCGARACTLVGNRILSAPTTSRAGRGVKIYKCLNCGNGSNHQYEIPKEEVPVIVPIVGGRGFGGGGGFSGGSFGGGMTGGGGASGGW